MKTKFSIISLLVLLLSLAALPLSLAAAPPQQTWSSSPLGTMQAPSQLEIIDLKDVLAEMLRASEKYGKPGAQAAAIPGLPGKQATPESLLALFDKYNIGLYQLAIKNGTYYHTAYAGAMKLPSEVKFQAELLLQQIKNADKKQQADYQQLITALISQAFTAPELQDSFKFEILDFYPFESFTQKNVQAVSVGGSVALRMYNMLQPVAFKAYLLRNSGEYYVFLVVNSGPDQKLWNETSKAMLLTL